MNTTIIFLIVFILLLMWFIYFLLSENAKHLERIKYYERDIFKRLGSLESVVYKVEDKFDN